VQFELTWIEPSLVVSRTWGVASAEGFAALYEGLISQPEFGPRVRVLSDHTNLDASALTAADVERIADSRAHLAGATGMRSAVVVGPRSPVRYGLARMFEAYTTTRGNDMVRVFETVDEAMTWLRSPDSPFLPVDAEVAGDPAP
jgi:hypothetical protein